MPHYKCVACHTRLHQPIAAREQVGDLCTECGTLLEPVGDLTELVGFRSIRPRHSGTGRHQVIADRAYDFLGYRDRQLARAHVDSERWADEQGSFPAEAEANAARGARSAATRS